MPFFWPVVAVSAMCQCLDLHLDLVMCQLVDLSGRFPRLFTKAFGASSATVSVSLHACRNKFLFKNFGNYQYYSTCGNRD